MDDQFQSSYEYPQYQPQSAQPHQPNPRRRKKQLAPWERALRKYWPPIRLLMIGAIVISLVVLLISCGIAAIV